VTPFHFGDSRRPLFGIYHPAQRSPARDTGVVLLNPLGHEAIRAHRALRQLALRLADAGFHSLRFDYYGTGDSAGDCAEGTLCRWVQDAGTASDELRDTAGVAKVSWVGLKLGAAVGVLAAPARRDLDTLVLWEPVVSGRAYLDELRALHAEVLARQGRSSPPGEILGFPLPDTLRAELEAFDLLAAPRPWGRRNVVLASQEGPHELRLRENVGSSYRSVSSTVDWSPRRSLSAGLVPMEALSVVAASLGAA
jgi:alpha/beta superfamily hydrolase